MSQFICLCRLSQTRKMYIVDLSTQAPTDLQCLLLTHILLCHLQLSALTELLQPMCSSDNVALPLVYPLPQCFGAMSQKLNKIVCTCSMSRKPFQNKKFNLYHRWVSTLTTNTLSDTSNPNNRNIITTQSELLPIVMNQNKRCVNIICEYALRSKPAW